MRGDQPQKFHELNDYFFVTHGVESQLPNKDQTSSEARNCNYCQQFQEILFNTGGANSMADISQYPRNTE